MRKYDSGDSRRFINWHREERELRERARTMPMYAAFLGASSMAPGYIAVDAGRTAVNYVLEDRLEEAAVPGGIAAGAGLVTALLMWGARRAWRNHSAYLQRADELARKKKELEKRW